MELYSVMEELIPEKQTLLNYKTPRRITENTGENEKKSKLRSRGKSGPVLSKSDKISVPPCKSRTIEETEEILNSILPPLVYEDGRNMWVKEVSSVPSTRLEVLRLQNNMDALMETRQGKYTGICKIRRQIYSQVFNEIIRQVTINCAERGLLLVRARNEIMLTISAYRTLYESSVAFGIRKLLDSEKASKQMEAQVLRLEDEIGFLKRKVTNEQRRSEILESSSEDNKRVREIQFNEDLKFLLKTNAQLKSQISSISARAIYNGVNK